MLALLKRPSAFAPLAMSAVVILAGAAHAARFGLAREADEGAAAHLFQILMPAQLPIIAFFALKWLPRSRGPALAVLTTQVGAAIAIVATIFLLGL
jgi:hypothetical protein